MGAHREGVWTGHDLRPCSAGPNWRGLALEGSGLVAGATMLAFFAAPFGLAFPVGAVVFSFGAFGLMGRHSDDRRRQREIPVQELREEFGVGPVWKVDLMVRQGEAPSGLDRGLVWIDEGRIVFSGLRTSFALVPEQAVGTVRHGPPLSGQRLRLNLLLARETPAGPLSLSFWPISEGLRRADNDAADLRSAVNRLLNGMPDRSPGLTGQWPPLEIGPGAPRLGELFLRALLPHLGGTLTAALLGLLALGFTPWIGLLVFAVSALAANVAVRAGNSLRWQAWHDARRMWGTE